MAVLEPTLIEEGWISVAHCTEGNKKEREGFAFSVLPQVILSIACDKPRPPWAHEVFL